MSRKNLLSGRDKELQELSEQLDAANREQRPIYLDPDDFADLADWYAFRGNTDKAMEVMQQALHIHPDNNTLLIELAYLHLDNHDVAYAKEVAERISEDYTTEAKILYANILINEGELDKAEHIIDTIEDKEDISNIIEIIYMYMDMGNLGLAEQWLEKGLKSYSDDEGLCAVAADYYLSTLELDKAAEYFNKLIDKNPYSATYWQGLARCHYENQEYDKAIDACDYALVSDEEFGDAYYIKGSAFFQLNNEEEAIKNYQKAYELKVISKSFFYAFVGLHKLVRNEWKEAFDYLEEALQEYTTSMISLPVVLANAGVCLYHLGRKEEALQYLNRAHEAEAEDVESYLIEGRLYLKEKEYEKAQAAWEQAVKNAPIADTWNEIALDCIEEEKIDMARIALEQVKKLEPDFDGINERLASVYMMLQEYDKFMEYNQLCENPISKEDLKRFEERLREQSEGRYGSDNKEFI